MFRLVKVNIPLQNEVMADEVILDVIHLFPCEYKMKNW